VSVTFPRGFRAAGVTAGMKPSGRPDLALLVADEARSAAGLFTTNAFAAAPVKLSKQRLSHGVARAVLVNSGQANAGTGLDGDLDAERSRFVSWWYFDEERRLGLEAELPAAQGAIVVRALELAADAIPAIPDERDGCFAPARRADALVAVCSARIARDADQDRAMVVVHAQLDGIERGVGGCEIDGGPVVHPQTVRRLLCNARVQTVLEDPAGNVLGLGRTSREPSTWMLRQLRYRDRECRFPGCGARRFTQAHHVVWWRHGGRTDLDNLLLICSFHHRLVHEHGWSVKRDPDGTVRWFLPGGARYRAGPSPGPDADHEILLTAAG